MRKLSVAIVSGGPPDLVRLAPVHRVLRGTDWAKVDWFQAGPHDETTDALLEAFRVTPTVRLQLAGDAACREAEGRSQLESAMRSRRFDVCLVQGDTESAFLGALSAFYCQVPVGHLEAGLGTEDLEQPIPGEELRQMITRLATFHFAPTKRAFNALIAEGVPPQSISLTGSTAVDAQLWAAARFGICCDVGRPRTHILVHVHGRAQSGHALEEMFRAVAAIARERPRVPVLCSVQRNPAAAEAAHGILGGFRNVRLGEAPAYIEMQRTLAGALVVLTDSRVLLRDAATYQTPVLALPGTCERAEAAEAGFASLVETDADAMASQVRRRLNEPLAWQPMNAASPSPGDGQAARRIANALARQFRPAALGSGVPDTPRTWSCAAPAGHGERECRSPQ